MALAQPIYEWRNSSGRAAIDPPAPLFSVGDAVFAKCGGPCMVVTTLRPDIWVDVQWFVGGVVQHESFPAASLRRANWFDRFCAAFGG